MLNPTFLAPSTWITLGVVVMNAAPFLFTDDWIVTHPHYRIVKHLTALKYKGVDGNGVCHGYGLTTCLTHLTGKDEVFKSDLHIVAPLQQIRDMEELKKNNAELYSRAERALETIALYQTPSQYTERFSKHTFLGIPEYPQQGSGLVQLPGLLPDAYKDTSSGKSIVCMYSGVRAYSYGELNSQMLYLGTMFKQQNERYSILFGNVGHAFACLYNPENNTWMVDDVNFGTELWSQHLTGPHSTEDASKAIWELIAITDNLGLNSLSRFGLQIIKLLDSLITGNEPRAIVTMIVLGKNETLKLTDHNENQINILSKQKPSVVNYILNYMLLRKAIFWHDNKALAHAIDLEFMSLTSSLLSSIANGNSKAVQLILDHKMTSLPISDQTVSSFMPQYNSLEKILDGANPAISNIVRNHEKYKKIKTN